MTPGGAKGAKVNQRVSTQPGGNSRQTTAPRQTSAMADGGGGRVAANGLPQMAAMSYGPRVVSKRVPVDPNDKSAFTINIPQGAKTIIKQAVEEYKQTNSMSADEVGLLEKFLGNLSSAVAPTNIFGHNPNAPAGYADGGAGGGEASHLIDEITDAPQLFEYDDIAHSGHMLVKVADLVEPPKGCLLYTSPSPRDS